MKKLLPTLLLSALFLLACGSEKTEDKNGTDPVEKPLPPEERILETLTEGDFSFAHRSQGEDYFVDVLYKDKKIGEFFKEVPQTSYRVYLLEESESFAYLALEEEAGEETPFGGALEVARVNLETSNFQILTTNGFVEDISSDDSKVALRARLVTGISVMDLTQALYPNGKNLVTYSPPEEFESAGDAQFSEDGTMLAYVALSADGQESAVYSVDLNTGEQKEWTRKEGRIQILGWEGSTLVFE